MTSPAARVTALLYQFVAFTMVGAAATALHYVILIALVEFASMSPVVASAIGYSLSAVLNYLLNYHYTFSASAGHATVLPRFLLVSVAGLVLNSGVMMLAVGLFEWHYVLAQVLATGLVLLWNFSANKLWSFR